MVELERLRLIEAKRDDLAAKVVWAAKDWGDGLGFDVLSFNEATDKERRIEVKTTALAKSHPFILTANELACSQAEPDLFALYRVFDYRKGPKVFRLYGSLADQLRLQPFAYRAGPSSD